MCIKTFWGSTLYKHKCMFSQAKSHNSLHLQAQQAKHRRKKIVWEQVHSMPMAGKQEGADNF